jgi:hypothetical protein
MPGKLDPNEFLKGFEAVPRDEADAIVREVIGMVPVIGDLFMLLEAFKAFSEGKALAGLIYLANFLPGPPLPATHLIVYELERGGRR